ncbi:hypothetical protein BDW66DRAFT_140678 [Aspergillus desertorum]
MRPRKLLISPTAVSLLELRNVSNPNLHVQRGCSQYSAFLSFDKWLTHSNDATPWEVKGIVYRRWPGSSQSLPLQKLGSGRASWYDLSNRRRKSRRHFDPPAASGIIRQTSNEVRPVYKRPWSMCDLEGSKHNMRVRTGANSFGSDCPSVRDKQRTSSRAETRHRAAAAVWSIFTF